MSMAKVTRARARIFQAERDEWLGHADWSCRARFAQPLFGANRIRLTPLEPQSRGPGNSTPATMHGSDEVSLRRWLALPAGDSYQRCRSPRSWIVYGVPTTAQ